jgi:predicted O-methyltransferase YrrM
MLSVLVTLCAVATPDLFCTADETHCSSQVELMIVQPGFGDVFDNILITDGSDPLDQVAEILASKSNASHQYTITEGSRNDYVLSALSHAYKKPGDMNAMQLKYLAAITDLYTEYAADLIKVRADAKRFMGVLASHNVSGMLNDYEAELTYLRLRRQMPKNVLEFSPNCGWSSFWILSALRDNGYGDLHSFDLIDCSMRTLQNEPLLRERWSFTQGNIFEALPLHQPRYYDYIFIDSAHDYEFTTKYIQAILQPHFEHSNLMRPLHFSVHDVYHGSGPAVEGMLVIQWLLYANGGSGGTNAFDVSSVNSPQLYLAVTRLRAKLGIAPRGSAENISPCDPQGNMCANSMLFVDMVNQHHNPQENEAPHRVFHGL